MINVLLVDDEEVIRQGLRKLVDWEAYGYHIAAEAGNGMDAIRILEEMEINLVFVDIKMPQMTGIEFVEYVRQNIARPIHFVILTGYAEFEYARQAMRLNILDYMLKPVQEEELVDILEQINGKYQSERQGEREQYHYHITQVLLGKCSEENITQVEKKLKAQEWYQYVSFEFEKYQREFEALPHEKRVVQQKQLRQYLQSLLEGYTFHVVPLLEMEEEIFGVGIILAKCLYQESGMGKDGYLEYLQKRVNQHFQYQIQVYVGQPVNALGQLSKSFASIQVARCLHGLAEGGHKVMDEGSPHSRKALLEIQESDVDQLLEAVKNNSRSSIAESSECIFSKIRSSGMNMELIKASIYHIVYRLMEMAEEFDDESNQQEILEYIGRESFHKLVLSGSSEEVTGFFCDYAGYLAQVRSQESRKILDRVDDYVRGHYREKLSLKSLGELFYVNSVYLGQLYKKKYGIVFRDYLNNLRIEKSQELLVQTDLRIYAIAEQVGFSRAEYFINKFVQANHMTPNQYRIRMRKHE